MRKQICLLICFVALCCNVGAQKSTSFSNPVIKGDLADPSVIRVGNTYYLSATSSEWAPFYPVYSSDDLVNWKQIGHVFPKLPEWLSSSFWAPELYYHNNQFYAYYTARRKSDGVSVIGVATSKDPASGFEDHGLIIEHGKEAIDAFVFEDNGQLYISWKAYGLDNRPIELLCSKLSNDGLHLEGEPFMLLRDDDHTMMEGQSIVKKDGYYYLLYAVNGCCGPKSDYAVYAARSKELMGPYEKCPANPILAGGDGFLSCGHGTMTTTPDGRMFYICHAYLSGAEFYGGRQPILEEMKVGADGWIHFSSGNVPAKKLTVPFSQTVQQSASDFEDAFDGDKLANEWTWNYAISDVKAEMKNGNLLLSGKSTAGTSVSSALCVRPVSPDYSIETQVVNQNQSFKGLTFYGDDKNLIVYGCKENKLVLKQVKDGAESTVSEITLPAAKLFLKMKVTKGCLATFFWSKDGVTWKSLPGTTNSADYSYLVRWDRVARPGLIHSGDSKNPAKFSYFKMNVDNSK